jgi:hypothetical protein
MTKKLVVMLVFVAVITLTVGKGSQSIAMPNARGFNGPMCVPGDPCGPHQRKDMGVSPTIVSAIVSNGPMCVPGDPCGPQVAMSMFPRWRKS